MLSSTIACPQCGTDNSIHRLWCRHCGRPLPARSAPPPVHHRLDTERAAIYKRVIDDVEAQAQNMEFQTYKAVKDFSADQIAEIEYRTLERQRLHDLHELVLKARAAASSGRLQDTLEILQNGLQQDRGEYQLRRMIAEVKEKIQQREQSLQANRKAKALFQDAMACLEADRLEEAEEHLRQARQLAPDDSRIMATLKQTEIRLAQQRERKLSEQEARKRAEQISAMDADEQLPTAEPIEESAPAGRRFADVSFVDEAEEIPSPMRRVIDSASQWSSVVKPFLVDNFGWFVGAFLVVSGFIVLIVTFWGTIEQNRILMHSLVYITVAAATGMFFALAYFMRVKYPQLETSSNVLLVIVALLIPLLFMAAMLTSFIPVTPADVASLHHSG